MGRLGIIIICLFYYAGLIEGIAQPDVDAMVMKFNRYQNTWPRTRLELIFNQQKYSAGDTAYFKAYFVTEDLLGVEGKHLINLDLVDSKGESRLHQLFNVTDGVGHNQIIIPETLSAGYYNVAAYSNWMRNFEASIFTYEIEIVVKNRLLRIEPPFIKAAVEGGHLIAGVFNKIVVQTSYLDAELQLIDEGGEVQQRFLSNELGFSSVIFKPEQGRNYLIKKNNEPEVVSLPTPEEDGCSLLLTPTRSGDPIKMIVTAPTGSVYREQDLVIIVSSKGSVYKTGTFSLGDKNFVPLEISQTDLPEGIAQTSILSKSGQLIASRAFYISKPPLQVSIQSDKPFYSTREKVTLNILLRDAVGNPVAGEFAIALKNESLFSSNDEHTLPEAQFLFGSPLLLNRSDEIWFGNLDNQLILSTRPLPWKKILAERLERPTFAASSAIEKSGVVYLGDSKEPVPDLTRVLFYLQRSGWHYQTFTIENGKVHLTLPDIYKTDELFYMVETKNGREVKDAWIEWKTESDMELPKSTNSGQSDAIDPYAAFMQKVSLINRSYGFFTNALATDSESNLEGQYAMDALRIKPDVSIDVQDYVLFPTIEELVREIVPSLFIRKGGKRIIVRVSLLSPMISTQDPLYIIDGIATKNSEFFLSLDPSEIVTIKLINDSKKLLPLGLLGKHGVVIVKTKSGDRREPLDSTLLQPGLSKSAKFNAHENLNERKAVHPDFRSTLYWNPSIETNADGVVIVEFYSSDDVTDWQITINGISKERIPFTANDQISVVPQPENN